MKRFLKGIFYRVCLGVEKVFPSDKGHVLMYHSFNLLEVFFNVSFDDFKQQIGFLQKNDYKIISLVEFLDRKEQGLSLKKYIAITCDDGYVGVLEMAQFLYDRNLPATIFWPSGVSGDLLRLSNGVEHKILSQTQMGELLEKFPNIALGLHGVTHRELTKISGEDMENELRQSLEDIKNFPRNISMIAYPRGKYNEKVLDTAKRLGYRAGFTTREGGVNVKTPLFEIPRLTADCTVDSVAFAGKLTRLYGIYVALKS